MAFNFYTLTSRSSEFILIHISNMWSLSVCPSTPRALNPGAPTQGPHPQERALGPYDDDDNDDVDVQQAAVYGYHPPL